MTSPPLRVAVAGASGRMGRMLIEAVSAADDLQLAGALDVASSPALGQDGGSVHGPQRRRGRSPPICTPAWQTRRC